MSEFIRITPTEPYSGTCLTNGQITQQDVIDGIGSFGDNYEEVGEPDGPVQMVADPVTVEGGLVYTAAGEQKTIKECFYECLLGEEPGAIGAAGVGAIASGSIPKQWVGVRRVPGTSRFTSIGSIIVHRNPKLRSIPVPRIIPNRAPVFRLGIPPVKMAPTGGGAIRFIGRWIPGIGWGLLAADLIILDQCIARCRNEPSFLMQFLRETVLPKPAY